MTADESERFRREYLRSRRYYYRGTQTLRNHFGMSDHDLLEEAERVWVGKRFAKRAPLHEISYEAYKKLHWYLFKDVYSWAGKERDYTTSRGDTPFELPEHIEPSMRGIFGWLNTFDDLKGCSREDYAWQAGDVANVINTCHPFINGNGRTLRAFLQDLSAQAGHPLHLSGISREEWYAVSRDAFEIGDGSPYYDLILKATMPAHLQKEETAMADEEKQQGTNQRIGPILGEVASTAGDVAEKASDVMGDMIDVVSEGVWSLLGGSADPSPPSLQSYHVERARPGEQAPPPSEGTDDEIVATYKRQTTECREYAARHWHDETGIAEREAELMKTREKVGETHPEVLAAEAEEQKDAQKEQPSQQFRMR